MSSVAAFYIDEYYPVLLRIADKGLTSNQVINLLPRDRESIFPQTEQSAASIRSDPIQFHNFRAWALTMLGLLGFQCTDPANGYYRLVAEPMPTFLSKANAEPENHLSSFELLQRTLQSMTLVGLGQHAKQIYNHMLYLWFQRRLLHSQGPAFTLFSTWCNTTLFRLFDLNIQPPFPLPDSLPDFKGTALLSLEYRLARQGTTMIKLESCRHGILSNYNATTQLTHCRVTGEKNCGFSIKPETREVNVN